MAGIDPKAELKTKLQDLDYGIKDKDIEYILENRDKFIHNPDVLLMKFHISEDQVMKIVDVIKQDSENTNQLTAEIKEKIDEIRKQHPSITPSKIALLFEIDESIVIDYLEMKLGTEIQEEKGKSSRLHFSGKEGKKVLSIINKYFPKDTEESIRTAIVNGNLNMKDNLIYVLKKQNPKEYSLLVTYLAKFKDSKRFEKVDENLTFDEIKLINESNLNIVVLSNELNKVETVVRRFKERFSPEAVEECGYKQLQCKEVTKIAEKFGIDTISFHAYRMIAVDPIKDIMDPNQNIFSKLRNNPKKIFERLLPWIFYYLKCYLPLTSIVTIIYDRFKIRLTTHQVFHMVFQHSDSLLRGFCIEHYSYSNPVPLYYPTFTTCKNQECEFEICKELWYSIRENNGLVSFGLGQAAFGRFGKSSMLDLIFETDFAQGNPINSPFHFKSIDIQITNNLYAADTNECTKWAFIDCNGYVRRDIIHVICQQLDIAIIHVSYHDHRQNKQLIKAALREFVYVKHVYIFIRDYNKELKKKIIDKRCYIFIPNIVECDPVFFQSQLKKIGHEILHLPTKLTVGRNFIEGTVSELKTLGLEEIQRDSQLLQKIMEHIKKDINYSEKLNFSCLNFYPTFINYMSLYYSALNETNRDRITEYNENRVYQKDRLDEKEIGEIVQYFNRILQRRNSVLVLWKLSQELSTLTDELNRNKNMSEDTTASTNDKYNLEILWREALLSYKYGRKDSDIHKGFAKDFAINFSNYVERGEAFELIDGDNLRYFNQEINSLLTQLYIRQSKEIKKHETSSKIKTKQAPIVVSIFGPQSSGKSTLLNYCFGCKFLTSAGRCTRGIYASLAKLSTQVNCSDQFLILDTEGLDAVERGNSIKHFDRTMVLFCLAVSQVVIVNINGDIGEQMQNLLQICAHSLLKLKVSKVAAPKVFFVLNQQVDPDKKKHIKSMNILLEKLDEKPLMETEEKSLSDLITVSRDNLFILPSAFNSNQMNNPTVSLFDSKVTKRSPTEDFADSCANLRLAIIHSLRNILPNERLPYKTMSEWMAMSGVIWDIIVKYQDIVKHKNFQEMNCYNLLNKEITNILDKHIRVRDHKDKFVTKKNKIIEDIEQIETTFKQNILLQESMDKFGEVYQEHQEECYIDFNCFCNKNNLITETNYVCDVMRSNLEKLLDIERNYYKDEIQNKIRACWYDQNISDLRVKLITAINKNIDINLDLNEKQLRNEYDKIWSEWSIQDLKEEEENERNKDFDDLYTLFKMESKMMENKHVIFELFVNSQFQTDKIIKELQSRIITEFLTCETPFSSEEDYIYPWRENNRPLKDMIPYTGKKKCKYLRPDSLYSIKGKMFSSSLVIEIKTWVPKECTDLIHSCSGYYNQPDITWKFPEWFQIKKLASCLKDPNNSKTSTWSMFVSSFSSKISKALKKDTQVTVKEVVHILCSTFKHVNHELNYIQANLTNKAEMTITTLAFIHVFKHRREIKKETVNNYYSKKEKQKLENCNFFLDQVNNRKLARGNWDRKKMRLNDEKNANRFALDFLERVRRGVLSDETQFILDKLEERKKSFSHETLMIIIDELTTNELNNQLIEEVLDPSNIVIQHICNRNELIKIQFRIQWEATVDQIYRDSINHMKSVFQEKLHKITSVITFLLERLSFSIGKEILSDSDSNFELANRETYTDPNSNPKLKESPLRAMTLYLKTYLDPSVTSENFKTFFENTFTVDGIEMSKNIKNWKLCDKPNNPDLVLSKETFKKLTDTKLLQSENIFNIHRYIKELLSSLKCYEYELAKSEYEEILSLTRDKYLGQAICCPQQCPSCGKFCDKTIGHAEKCQITSGHQICSMGGKVWKNDDDHTAVLITEKVSVEISVNSQKL